MKYLLDTNICIYWFKGDKDIEERLLQIVFPQIFISEITLAELFYGAYRSTQIEANIKRIKGFTEEVNILWLDEYSLESFGKIKADLANNGNLIDDFDIMIGSEAICNDCVLVTNNVDHFKRIKDLVIENWKDLKKR